MADTKTADHIRSELSAAFDMYIAELQQAGPHWEQKPQSGDGEDAWSARQVAEHVGPAEPFFGLAIAQAIGVPGPTLARGELPDVANAVAKTRSNHETLAGIVAQVRDEHIAIPFDHPRLGKQTVGSLLDMATNHLTDHTNQLKTLRGA